MGDSDLTSTANLFLALGDATRLRLLNLMRDGEVCVSSFTEILGHSQPLVSRHLAYLRNAGVVAARRDGKWIYYSISDDLDDNTLLLITELFKWMEKQPFLNQERARYLQSIESKPPALRQPRPERMIPNPMPIFAPEDPVDIYHEPAKPPAFVETAHHNELEDFLL